MKRESFDSYYSTLAGGRVFRWLDWAKLRLIRKVLSGKGSRVRVLDLGCGSAAISGKLVGSLPGIEVWGGDHSDALLAQAQARGIRTQHVNFDEPLPFPNDHFDAVLMIDTIEHVDSRQETIAEVKRILHPQGSLIVFTPPYDSLTWWMGERFFYLATGRKSDHITPFTRESLDWLLGRNFENREIRWTNFGLSMMGVGTNKK